MKKKTKIWLCILVLTGFVLILTSNCKKDEESKLTVKVPVLTTSSIANISQTTATCGGNIKSDGGSALTAKGVCWGIDSILTNEQNKTTDGVGSGSFISSITGLNANTTYYVKAYATNSAGTGYGETLMFVTLQEIETVTDFDSNIYHTVTIGNQVWMVENLKVTHYRNGDPIPNITDNTEWVNLKTGAYCDYQNAQANGKTYGKLFNWYAVHDSRNIAPAGWHVPTDTEWSTLINYLGGDIVSGSKMKDIGSSHWKNDNLQATNESGFTALPGGYRDWVFGDFKDIGNMGFWWSSTEETPATTAWGRRIYSAIGNVDRYPEWEINAFSVRCIQD